MKIFFIAHSAGWGGGEVSLLNLAASLDHKRFPCVVALPGAGPLRDRLMERRIPVVDIQVQWWTQREGNTAGDPVQRFLDGLEHRVARVVDEIRTTGVDLVFTQTSVIAEGALAARCAGVPHVWQVCENLSGIKELTPLLDYPVLYSLVEKWSTCVIAISRAVADDMGRFHAMRNVEVCHPGLDTPPNSDSVAEARLAFGLEGDGPVMACVGALHEGKGILDVARAAPDILRAFPSARFLMVGAHTAAVEQLKRILEEEGCAPAFRIVHLCPDVMRVYRAADALVSASHSEGFGLTMLEAMISGIPVVAARNGGSEELVLHGQTGLLTPVRDPAALARSIIGLLRHPDRARAWGEAGRRRARSCFSLARSTGALERILDRVARDPRPSPLPLENVVDELRARIAGVSPRP